MISRREDLAGPVAQVAPMLLGCVLRLDDVAIRIVEVEAYAGADDPASHSFRGPTDRNRVMFGRPGHAYVYFSYGMHWALNVVCAVDGVASGALVRAGEVVSGLELARARRVRSSDRDLARGPGRLTQALGVTAAHKGVDLFAGPLRLEPGEPPVAISSGPRVGVQHAADRPWRFWVSDSPYVSAYRRHPRAGPTPAGTASPAPRE